MKLLSSICVVFSIFSTFGQQPSFFKIGEEELAGIHVYDLLQDQQKDYWIATNNGLYLYDYYNFIKIDCPEMSSSSVFNLVENKEGQIFCNNLSGQIFKIENGKMNLYFQVPDSLMHHEISIGINDREQLTVLTTNLFTIDDGGVVTVFHSSNKNEVFGGDIIKDEKGHLNFYGSYFDKVLSFADNKITERELLTEKFRPWLICLNGNRLIFHRGTGDLAYKNGEKLENLGPPTMAGAIFYTDQENIWRASRTGGVKIYDQNLTPLYNDKLVLQEYFISSLLKDDEGNILLGTFGDGLLVIPSMATNEYKLPGINERASKVINVKNAGLYVGCRSGKVFEIDQKGAVKLVSDQSKKTIEYMFHLPSTNELIFDGNPNQPTLAYQCQSGALNDYELYSVKDVKQIKGTKYLIANNQGCFWFDTKTAVLDRIDPLFGRTNCIGYEHDSEIIYSGSSAGLIILNQENKKYFELNNEPIICRNILEWGGKIYITTQKQGVLIFENGELEVNWNTATGLSTNSVFEILPFEDQFVLSSSEGVFLLSNSGKELIKLSTAVGLSPSQPIDIELFESSLYVVYGDAIKVLDIGNIQTEKYLPQVDLKKWTINDVETDLSASSLSANQTKVQFTFSTKSLKHNDETYFHYQLSGIDEDWQTKDYSQNVIEYKTLPSGDYNFKYYASNNGEKSETKTFAFTVATPFYLRLWFVLLVLVLFLLIVYLIYKLQLKRQNKLAKLKRESIESKLTAIQSQMNPHFIFNSLNSIQDLVLQQDQEKAYTYISKFAFLVRKVLHYSEVDYIRLDEEIKMLEVYLELEKLRFEDDFDFKIESDLDDETEIPPMLIQPYVENAVKHGLLHKEGTKKLIISFQMNENEMHIRIEDNGVGREKSKEINQRKSKGHKSFATKSTAGRFEILKNVHQGDFGAQYIDLENPSGTVVVLNVPIRKNY